MLLVVLILLAGPFFASFFYCQSLCSGLPRKRWAIGGFFFGPLLWPLFSMKKRMLAHQYYALINAQGIKLARLHA